MAAQSERGYQDHRYYNSNGSYRIVYTAGSAAPRYDEPSPAPAHKPQKQPARQPQKQSAQTRPAKKRPQYSYKTTASAQQPKARRTTAQQPKARAAVTQQPKAGRTAAQQPKARRTTAQTAKRAPRRTAQAVPAAPRTAPSGNPAYGQPSPKPLTKEDQNARTRREHIARNNQKRESYMNRSLATFLVGMAAVVCGCCGMYVHATAETQETQAHIAELNTQIEEARAENDAHESAVYSGLDLETIRTDAEELGMVSLEDAKIRYFTVDDAYVTDTVTLTE